MRPSTLPSDLAAESALVSLALLTHGDAFDRVADRIDADSFFDIDCRAIWRVIGKLRLDGDHVDEWSVADALTGKVEKAAIKALADDVTAFASDEQRHARIVAEMHQRRMLIMGCSTASMLASDVSRPHAEVVAEAEKGIYEALRTVRRREPWRPMPELVDRVKVANLEAARERGRIMGVTTGITELDQQLRGLREGELVVIGGRTSEGKSALALCIADHLSNRGGRSAYFSCEITGEDLARRLIASEGVSIANQESYDFYFSDNKTPKLESIKKIDDAYRSTSKKKIEVVYQPKITIPQVRTWCRRLLTMGPMNLIVIDYLALMGGHEKTERRDREIASLTAGCLELGAEFGVPIIAIQGLNRKSAGDGRLIRPEISHLMDSSAIEYDAHKILLVHNPNAKADGSHDDDGTREIIVAKNRSGKRGRAVNVRFLDERFKFVDDAEPMVSHRDGIHEF